jgi:hypothetical protein
MIMPTELKAGPNVLALLEAVDDCLGDPIPEEQNALSVTIPWNFWRRKPLKPVYIRLDASIARVDVFVGLRKWSCSRKPHLFGTPKKGACITV